MILEKVFLFLVAVLVLGVLIFVHELGHFLVAKLRRVGVFEFAIGFGKKIWRRRIGETYYAIGIIPLGGYVRMCGDDPYEAYGAEEKREPGYGEAKQETLRPESLSSGGLKPEDAAFLADRSRWLLEKGFFSKASIVLAGPLANFLFALLLSIASFWLYGRPIAVNKPLIGGVFPDYPAAQAGLKAGDYVRELDGRPLSSWDDLARAVRLSGGREMELRVERKDAASGVLQTVIIRVRGTQEGVELGLIDDRPEKQEDVQAYKIGIVPETERRPVGLLQAVGDGAYHVWYLCRITGRILVAMVRGIVSPSKVVGGPIAVFAGAAKSAGRGLEALLDFMVLLGVSLAIFNLLPIPILDGGHLVFFVIEALKGGPIGLKWQTLANQVGMAILILLMTFALYNDVVRLF